MVVYLSDRGWTLLGEQLAKIEELEESTQRYREIAELLPHMVWTANDNGCVDFCNQRWREYVDDDRTWLDALHPEDRTAAMAAWNDSMRSARADDIGSAARRA